MEIEKAKAILREIFREVNKYGIPLHKRVAEVYQCLEGDVTELIMETEIGSVSDSLVSWEEIMHLAKKV